MTTLVLASASPARLTVLRGAGVEPVVRVSGVDEDVLVDRLGPSAAPETVVTTLAEAKARDVIPALLADGITDAVVIGCDSMLHIDGQLQGKPHTVDVARRRWQSMAGRSATLLTGHSVLRLESGEITAAVSDCSGTVVHFGTPSDDELEAYLASGEPLKVAGAFTLDSLGGWFVERLDGDPSSVVGIGLPLVRRLLADVGVSVAALWATARVPR
ncbi:nucleoside triphosphate pyrophosphatase [Prescottella sp. R16]|uniref:Maf family protein n=1 Tax=Prescottella sp. R16 TaxID=3064529 RepID=UPI00272DFEB5|nr:nucleoside triphosphate pyrophosphatase [Prescottella sp. R16]